MNEREMQEANRDEARKRNEDLKKSAATCLAKNAEWNKKNKPKKVKE